MLVVQNYFYSAWWPKCLQLEVLRSLYYLSCLRAYSSILILLIKSCLSFSCPFLSPCRNAMRACKYDNGITCSVQALQPFDMVIFTYTVASTAFLSNVSIKRSHQHVSSLCITFLTWWCARGEVLLMVVVIWVWNIYRCILYKTCRLINLFPRSICF